jgi:hypothetical protein
MSIVERLTEGIVNRDLSTEGAALINKWEQTGLLEGIGDDNRRNGMARLLENQAKELLRESSSMAAGDVEGFAAVAFPLVRRVFGSLIANDLVSVQPMSLPSGLIFFLDFKVSTDIGDGETADDPRLGYPTDTSLYGGGVVGSQLTGGVDLTGVNAERGPYALNNGYSSPTGSVVLTPGIACSGSVRGDGSADYGNGRANETAAYKVARAIEFDPDILSGATFCVGTLSKAAIDTTANSELNPNNFITITPTGSIGAGNTTFVRRLTRFDDIVAKDDDTILITIISMDGSVTANALSASLFTSRGFSFAMEDNFDPGGAVGSVLGQADWGLENEAKIPEIDIQVDSVAVTAVTKKLKAKWTPELGQDLNAYHNLDAEVELTQILSEQIALEIDREILEDLVRGATAGTRYWSRYPGDFLDRETGAASVTTQDFTGNVSEWYETLVETINDVSAQIHRKTLRGGANFVVCGPEVANILEFTAGFRANVTADADRGDIGAVKVGALSKKFDVMVDPYFPRQLVLVGRRGASFLESGYVYAPYVPLQTTPTIFGVEDFVPRKGVMTRYAKKMVRPDMYGLVVCKGLVGS